MTKTATLAPIAIRQAGEIVDISADDLATRLNRCPRCGSTLILWPEATPVTIGCDRDRCDGLWIIDSEGRIRPRGESGLATMIAFEFQAWNHVATPIPARIERGETRAA